MERFTIEGSKDTLIDSIYQILTKRLSSSLPDFSILQYIYEELLLFLGDKDVEIRHIDLYFESNFIDTCILFDSLSGHMESLHQEIMHFLSESGLFLLLHKFELRDNNSLIFNYSLSYIDGNLIDKRHQLIQSYWKTSSKIRIHG